MPYAFYTFFNHADVTVEQPVPHTQTTAPQLQHSQEYPCVFSAPFMSYLCFGSLPLVVFNDLDAKEVRQCPACDRG